MTSLLAFSEEDYQAQPHNTHTFRVLQQFISSGEYRCWLIPGTGETRKQIQARFNSFLGKHKNIPVRVRQQDSRPYLENTNVARMPRFNPKSKS